jgi:transposase
MHNKNYLAAKHARLTRRRGMGRAQVAVAHSILVAAYHMLQRDQGYADVGPDWHERRNNEAHTRRLVAQLERVGHTVIIKPGARSTASTNAGTPTPLQHAHSWEIHGSGGAG